MIMQNILFDNILSLVGYKQEDYVTMARVYIDIKVLDSGQERFLLLSMTSFTSVKCLLDTCQTVFRVLMYTKWQIEWLIVRFFLYICTA